MKRQPAAAAIRVAVAAPFPDIVRIHESTAEYADEIEVCAMISDPGAVLDQARILQPDVLLLSEELGAAAADTLTQLGNLAPDTRLVMLVADMPAAGAGPIADAVIRLDAPPDQLHAVIVSSVGRSVDNHAPAAETRTATALAPDGRTAPLTDAPDPSGRTTVVFSGKGGVGTSIVATNLAAALAARGSKVALLDLDLQFGDVGMLLHLEAHPVTIDVLARRTGPTDAPALDEALATGPGGLRVLLAPRSPEASDLVTVAAVDALLRQLPRVYDHVVVDSPGQLEERIVTAMEMADQVLLVSSFGLAAVKDTKVTLRLLQSLGFEPGRVALVLNQAQPGATLGADEIETTLHFPALGILPYEPRMDASVERGTPLVVAEPRSPFSRQLERIADMVAQAAPRTPTSTSEQRARWRLRFGR